MFASSIKAKNALDIGCFTGYSALYLFFSLFPRSDDPPSVLTIDNDEGRIAEAQKFFHQIDPKKSVIKTMIGDAFTILKGFETEEYAKELHWNQSIRGNEGVQQKEISDDDRTDYSHHHFYRFVGSNGQPPFDLIYLDADKDHYPLYYQLLLDKHYLSPNGLLFIDNVLLFTAFVAPWPKLFGGNAAEGVINLNKLIANDKRVEVVVLPFRDGLAVIKWSSSHLRSCSICAKRWMHRQEDNDAAHRKNGHSARATNGMINKKSIVINDHYQMDSLSLNGDMIPFAFRSEKYYSSGMNESDDDRHHHSSSYNNIGNGRSKARG